MPTGTLLIDVRIASARSLKDKRSVVRHLLEVARRRHRVASAEVGSLDRIQRAELAFASVGATYAQVEAVLDAVERFVWSDPMIEVLDASREWSASLEEPSA